MTVSGINGVTFESWNVERVSDTEMTVELIFGGDFDTDDTLTFYDTKGAVVRELEIGHQPAAYWDGRNLSSELVASGIYFYQLYAGRPRRSAPHRTDYTGHPQVSPSTS